MTKTEKKKFVVNYDIAAVDINTYTVYDFLRNGETEEELLERANKKKNDNIVKYKEYIEEINDSDFWKMMLSQAERIEYRIMRFDEYMVGKRKHMLSGEIKEVVSDIWYEQLNVLPPLKWCTRDGVEMFCMSEMYDGTYTTQYAKYNGKYYSKMVDVMDESTWIYHFLLEKGE